MLRFLIYGYKHLFSDHSPVKAPFSIFKNEIAIFLLFSDLGEIKLGQKDDEPDLACPFGLPCCLARGWELG